MTQFDRAFNIVRQVRLIADPVAMDEGYVRVLRDAADEIERLIEVVVTLSEHYER